VALNQRHEQEAAMTITERDVIPRGSDQEFLVECWKQCPAEMIADVGETKIRWKDASELLKADSAAAIAEARAAFSDTLLKLEHSIDERLGRLRKLISMNSSATCTIWTRWRIPVT
jgi:hypothetical protein